MARNRKRQANGSAWHRKFDDCWYATVDGKRARLRDEAGQPIRGKDHREQAHLAVARLKLQIPATTETGSVLVADVVDAYVENLKASATPEYADLPLQDFLISATCIAGGVDWLIPRGVAHSIPCAWG